MIILKLIRWLLTAVFVFAFLVNLWNDPLGSFGMGVIALIVLFLLWLVPRAVTRKRADLANSHARRNPKFREGFTPGLRHDNIVLNTAQDTLWIRDASGAERYLRREDLLSWKTAHDWNNGTFRQRIELDVRDVEHPQWFVLFQRHSDTWIKSSKHNGQERDEWFARLRAWSQSTPAQSDAQRGEIDLSLPHLHRQYAQARSDEGRHASLVAFDITCLNEDLDQRTQWEHLGGVYPGPSPDLLRVTRRD